MAEQTLALRLLGPLQLTRGDAMVALPQSRKTRALLAYLAVAGRPQRREHLCGLLWDLPDDPRGALRWSLSRLRSLIDEPDRKRIVADREYVRLDTSDIAIDLARLRRLLASGPARASTEELRQGAALFHGSFLEGLTLPDSPEFQAWCAAEREEVRALHGRIAAALCERLAEDAEAALPYARAWARIEPYQQAAHAQLLRMLAATGRLEEAEQQLEASRRLFAEIGSDQGDALAAAWRHLRRSAGAAVPEDGAAGGHPAALRAARPDRPAASEAPPAEPAPEAPPERPSIAVLAFANLSADPDRAYLADGIVEEITCVLSRVRDFFVIARMSASAFKDTDADPCALTLR